MVIIMKGEPTGLAPLSGTPPDISTTPISWKSLKSLGKIFKSIRNLFSASKYLFKVTAKEGDIIFYSIKVGEEIIEFGGEFKKADDVLTIKNFDIDGKLTNKLGIKNLKNIMNEFGKQQGVSKVVVEGAKRTTGANPGRLPAKLIFDIN